MNFHEPGISQKNIRFVKTVIVNASLVFLR